MIRKLLCAAATAALLLVASCTKTPPVGGTPTVQPADPLWSQLISAHTTGAVSRRTPLRVTFTNDVIPADKVGADASAYLEIEPTTKVKVTFASRREIVATPASGELIPDTTYKVRVTGKGLTGIDPKLEPYEFLVQTLAPNFDVSTYGLGLDPANDERMVLRGAISTADTEDAAKLEKVSQLGMRWQWTSRSTANKRKAAAHPRTGSGIEATQPLTPTSAASRRPVAAAKPRWRPGVGMAIEEVASMAWSSSVRIRVRFRIRTPSRRPRRP